MRGRPAPPFFGQLAGRIAPHAITARPVPSRIVVVTDAWTPQVNGVVRTLCAVRKELESRGHAMIVISPDRFTTLPCPTYPEIRLAMSTPRSVGRMIAQLAPDAIHLATEGPLCLAARYWCLRQGLPFTTAFHTNFPDYMASRTGLPARLFWPYFRWFHGAASVVLASTPSIREALAEAGIRQTQHWGRGVDLAQFSPDGPRHPRMAGPADGAGPVLLYVGRVAVEKNVEAFLALDHPGAKVVVGDGPARESLQARFPDALFLGVLGGQELASAYRAADALVFPSLTDTFGLVMIEAMACGTPVAAYPVTGPKDIVTEPVGCLDEDLARAVAGALTRDRAACADYGSAFTWDRSASEFLAGLHPIVPMDLRQAA
ncbi:glycosyltransferase family 1 protein [Sphingobium sufflavum]|uniref:glycosyltransferase family 4 protein n=1 Tax=Sphingobium sufflavum TaxID=1129547 RepID=UPI001F3A66E2|nr:glycosyltransferase family 1 protein [Sphingobium sufflavum]MCE7796092.1 glycosyltransferase family 1 protein [Sphingobium sufflavum]